MGDWPQGDKSGREVYQQLWHAQDSAHKRVYILASHSHFFMEDVYQTADWKNKVLPGWIIGTAGAVRYRIPPEAGPAQKAQTDVYGYMIGTVARGRFRFIRISKAEPRRSPRHRSRHISRGAGPLVLFRKQTIAEFSIYASSRRPKNEQADWHVHPRLLVGFRQ